MRRTIATFALLVPLAVAALAQPAREGAICLTPVDEPGGGDGLALVALDWDADQEAELAWGASGKYSSADGLLRAWNFERSGTLDLEALVDGVDNQALGAALAVGDFDGDQIDELAIGSPGVGGGEGGGQVVVLEYSPGFGFGVQLGITLVQGSGTIEGSDENHDRFGSALAAGDFDGDGYDDLAVGVPGESWPFVDGSLHGAVHVFYGGAAGLDGARDLAFGQDSFIGQTREHLDGFGFALAAGDLDGDGFDDLAIGVPRENEGSIEDSGVVHVAFGFESLGLRFDRQQTWSQSSSGIAGGPEAGDAFGSALAIGDFDRQSISPIRSDLAISVACEAIGDLACAGGVHVLFSGAAGPAATGSQFLTRPGGSATDHGFGIRLVAADLDRDKLADLVVSASGPLLGVERSGEAHLFYGRSSATLQPSGVAPWTLASSACLGGATQDASRYANTVAVGDFDGDGLEDLALGISGWTDLLAEPGKGAAEILYGSLFTDGFDTGDAARWSASAP